MHGIIFSLKASFSAQWVLQIFFKVSQNWTKLQQTNNTNKTKQTTKRPFFLPKINKVFLRPILQNLKGRSVLDNLFFENDPLDEPNQMPPSKKLYLFRKLVKTQNGDQHRNYPSLTLLTAKLFYALLDPPTKYFVCENLHQIQQNQAITGWLRAFIFQTTIVPSSKRIYAFWDTREP